MLAELVAKTRSCRRFDASHALDLKTLEGLVDLARQTASGGNLQPLKYLICCDPKTNAEIFGGLRWAGYLKNWEGPGDNEKPTGYIVIVRDNEITNNSIIDHGIAAQTIALGAAEKDLACCIMGTVDRPRLRKAFDLSSRYEILLVIAVGKRAEPVKLDEAVEGEIRYWRDAEGVHHVPKRPLSEVLLKWKQ